MYLTKQKNNTRDMRYVTCDMLHMTCDTKNVT